MMLYFHNENAKVTKSFEFSIFIKKMLFRLICKTFDYIISGNDTQFSGFAQIRNTQFIIAKKI